MNLLLNSVMWDGRSFNSLSVCQNEWCNYKLSFIISFQRTTRDESASFLIVISTTPNDNHTSYGEATIHQVRMVTTRVKTLRCTVEGITIDEYNYDESYIHTNILARLKSEDWRKELKKTEERRPKTKSSSFDSSHSLVACRLCKEKHWKTLKNTEVHNAHIILRISPFTPPLKFPALLAALALFS